MKFCRSVLIKWFYLRKCYKKKKKNWCPWIIYWLIYMRHHYPFNTLTSVCIFSILFSTHSLRFTQGEFVKQSRSSKVGDHFLYSCVLSAWFRADISRRNKMLVTLRSQKVKATLWAKRSILLCQEVNGCRYLVQLAWDEESNLLTWHIFTV